MKSSGRNGMKMAKSKVAKAPPKRASGSGLVQPVERVLGTSQGLSDANGILVGRIVD